MGTELCDHMTGECRCFAGVEGETCDQCMVDHWGFDSGPNVSTCIKVTFNYRIIL